LRLRVFHVPVHIHHARGALEGVANLRRNFKLLALIGAIDLGH
jgi:hypothetical protein